MAMTALEPITFPCLKYLDKERKVGTCIKKDLIYCLLVLEVQCPRQTSQEEHNLEGGQNKFQSRV